MTADPHHTEQGPGRLLSASLAASTPLAGASRRPDPSGGPQNATEGRETLREQYAAAVRDADEHWCQEQGGVDYAALAAAVLAVRDRELQRLEKLHQAHLRVEARLAGGSLAAESAVERIRLLIAAHRPRLRLADPVLLGKLERVVAQVAELEAAGGGERA